MKKLITFTLILITLWLLTRLLAPVFGLFSPSHNAVSLAQAQAAIEAARAAQSAAEAAQISAQGLADVARGQVFILGVLILFGVAGVGLAAGMWLTRQSASRSQPAHSSPAHLPLGDTSPRRLPAEAPRALPDVTELIQLEQLRLLAHLRREHKPAHPALPADEDWS